MEKFDITTPEGREIALDVFDKYGRYAFPQFWFLWQAGKLLTSAVESLTSGAVTNEIEEQKKAAIEIIQAGKENGVDELEITMSEKVGLNLGSDIEGFPVELMAGSSGTMTLKVKYKHDIEGENKS